MLTEVSAIKIKSLEVHASKIPGQVCKLYSDSVICGLPDTFLDLQKVFVKKKKKGILNWFNHIRYERLPHTGKQISGCFSHQCLTPNQTVLSWGGSHQLLSRVSNTLGFYSFIFYCILISPVFVGGRDSDMFLEVKVFSLCCLSKGSFKY